MLVFWLTLQLGNTCSAQSDTVFKQKQVMHFSGFIDVFYAYDFNRPRADFRQPFLYNHNRHNEFNLNLGLVKVGIDHPIYSANLAWQAGTYAIDNYAAEPDMLRHIHEANIGLALHKKKNLRLDAGIFGSIIGFESALSLDNWTLTRSLIAENSPYYLSGAKLTYIIGDKWELVALACNGWQRIKRVSNNSLTSFCTQVKFTPTPNVSLNWSTFSGTDDPDSTRRMRYFHNFYGQFQFSPKFGLIAGFDVGSQQLIKNGHNYHHWIGAAVIGRYSFSKHWATACRAEYYQDQTGIIITSAAGDGFKASGFSLNVDYSPAVNVSCRLEGRWLSSLDKIFEQDNQLVENNFFIVSSIALRFDK